MGLKLIAAKAIKAFRIETQIGDFPTG